MIRKYINLLSSRVLSIFLKLDLYDDHRYDVKPTFSDIAAYTISASGYSLILSSWVGPLTFSEESLK